MTRVTQIVPDTRITQTELQTRIRIAGPSVSGSSSGGSTARRRRIEHITSDLELEAADTDTVYTNRGASDDIDITLPPSASLAGVGGEVFRFRVHQSGLYLRVTAPGSDAIRCDSIDATYMRCAERGGSIELEHQGSGLWFVVDGVTALWLFDE